MEPRYFCHCCFCETAFVVNDDQWDAAHSCDGLEAEKARYIFETLARDARLRVAKPDLLELTEAQKESMTWFAVKSCVMYFASARRLNFKQTVKPTKCGPKCWGAKREDCACECEGHNHGIGRAPTTVAA